MDIEQIRHEVLLNAPRIKRLGYWDKYVSIESLTSRIPESGKTASGFDAGIACCLDLIPRNKQGLSATLHAAYTPEAVEQLRKETALLTDSHVSEEVADSETVWWLAACDSCNESDNSETDVVIQVSAFKSNTKDPIHRLIKAENALSEMKKSFSLIDGIPIATQDGGMQAAYIAGHSFAVGMGHGLWFVGTFHPTLGIPQNFVWGGAEDEQGRPTSGPIHGSKQFIKCATLKELSQVVEIISESLQVYA